ncbi:hypothetical protein ACFQY7_23805 [Actinomadura luteofluorescens]|uniref:hypothetical protein n=1 Tax=Actinomadura luteofluorescens TaxID=46163 RepID=UPI0036352032
MSRNSSPPATEAPRHGGSRLRVAEVSAVISSRPIPGTSLTISAGSGRRARPRGTAVIPSSCSVRRTVPKKATASAGRPW